VGKGQLTPESFAKVAERSAEYLRLLSVYGDYDRLRGDPLISRIPFLLPPTWRKTFSGFYADLWDAAVRSLKTATRVIIIGYSVPITDLQIRYLLAAGLQENISLRSILFVNKAFQEEAGRRQLTARLFGTMGLFRQEHLDQGVIELIATDTREFFTGPHDYSKEPYRVLIGRPMNREAYTGDDAPFLFSDSQTNLGAWR
jgi:hypothetical protein